MDKELSIVLPVYNECENLAILIPHIEETFKEYSFELIIVDDNSKDVTQSLLHELNKFFLNVRSIKRENVFGIGSALRDGYNIAQGKYILSSDADLSFSPTDMLRLYEKVLEGYDMVLGYKCRDKKVPHNFFKSFISILGNMLVRTLSGIQLRNFSTNFRIIRASQWKKIKTCEDAHPFLFESVLKANHLGLRICEIPIIFHDRKYGKSKLNFFREAPRFLIKVIKYTFIEK